MKKKSFNIYELDKSSNITST